MKIKCLRVGGLLAPYFSPGVEYRASLGDNDIVHCREDDKNTVAEDCIPWSFWRMPNGIISAYQKENHTLFEVVDHDN